jgi:hypothetical protein
MQHLSEKFLILRRIQLETHKRTQVFTYDTRHSCQILMKLEFSRQIFKKYLNIIFHEYPSSGRRVVSWGQTDRQT